MPRGTRSFGTAMTPERIFTLSGQGTDPYENLALEQVLTETEADGVCTLYLWQNARTVVIGRNQNARRECRIELLEAEGGRLARRLSGGGAVYHDLGNLNFTFLVKRDGYDTARQLSVITRACRSLGVAAEVTGRNDVTVCGRKFSGNAFYRHGDCMYHHGTLLVEANLADMTRYLRPSAEKLAARGVESVRARVVNLRELRPDLTVAALKSAMTAAFGEVYGMNAEPYPISLVNRAEVAAARERNASRDWTLGRDPERDVRYAGRFPWGGVEIGLSISGGRVSGVTVETDAMDWEAAERIRAALPDVQGVPAALAEAVRASGCDPQLAEDLAGLFLRGGVRGETDGL